jgi:hypothetical protein
MRWGIGKILPMETAIDFIYQIRKVLESDLIFEHLHEWINLVFGIDLQKYENCNNSPYFCMTISEMIE